VTDQVFLFRPQPGEGFPERGIIKDRVIAKTVLPIRLREYATPDATAEAFYDPALSAEADHADKAGPPPGGRHRGQQLQQFFNVLLVIGSRSGKPG